MSNNPKSSTQRASLGGDGHPVSVTILSNDDPEGLGRLLVYLDTWDPSKVPLENGLWAHIDDTDPQTGTVGSTKHVFHLAGSRGHVMLDPAGTARFMSAATSYNMGDAPAGSAMAPKGEPTYPGQHPPEKA